MDWITMPAPQSNHLWLIAWGAGPITGLGMLSCGKGLLAVLGFALTFHNLLLEVSHLRISRLIGFSQMDIFIALV